MIAIGCDHAGLPLKEAIEQHLRNREIPYKDFGCFSLEECQYPVYGYQVAKAVASGECECGLLFCGTGMGMAILANKVKGIRAACVGDCYTAKMSKMHNNANVLTMGARVVGPELGKMVFDAWYDTEYELRHQVRVDMITEVEQTGELKMK